MASPARWHRARPRRTHSTAQRARSHLLWWSNDALSCCPNTIWLSSAWIRALAVRLAQPCAWRARRAARWGVLCGVARCYRAIACAYATATWLREGMLDFYSLLESMWTCSFISETCSCWWYLIFNTSLIDRYVHLIFSSSPIGRAGHSTHPRHSEAPPLRPRPLSTAQRTASRSRLGLHPCYCAGAWSRYSRPSPRARACSTQETCACAQLAGVAVDAVGARVGARAYGARCYGADAAFCVGVTSDATCAAMRINLFVDKYDIYLVWSPLTLTICGG